MPVKNLKSKITDFFIVLACAKSLVSLVKLIIESKERLNQTKKKKQLNQEKAKKELEEFIKKNDINSKNIDPEQFKHDFMQYLVDKNYDCEGMEAHVNVANFKEKNKESVEAKKLPRNIQKISEDLNVCIDELEMFSRTFNMVPGMVCYTIEEIAPNDKKPYVTYCPSPRVITQVHENGANGGTIILTRSHQFVKSADFGCQKTGKVISEAEALYSPLTKEHALYVCKILNVQSRLFYMKQVKKQQKTK